METQENLPLKRKNKTRSVWLKKGGLVISDEEIKLKRREYQANYRLKNKEKVNESQRLRKLKKGFVKKPTIIDWKDKDAVKEYRRTYVLKNKEKYVEYAKKHKANLSDDKKQKAKERQRCLAKIRYDKNPSTYLEANKKWRDKNGKEYNRQYRAKKKAKLDESKRPYKKTDKWLKMHEKRSTRTFIGHLRNLEANKIEQK